MTTLGGGASASLVGVAGSTGGKGRGMNEKLAEMETFRDILCRQIDTLQSYFDSCSDVAEAMENKNGGGGGSKKDLQVHPTLSKEILLQHGLNAVDFKGEAITFKVINNYIRTSKTH